jgi:dTDP-4-dehydrorhamnose reductase
MAHQIEIKKNYIYIKMSTTNFEFNNDTNFITSLRDVQKENPNIIINCATIESISDDDLFRIKKLYQVNAQMAGHIIISEISDELGDKLQLIGLNCIHTDDEAIDYIFMEQLEQEFLKDFDKED